MKSWKTLLSVARDPRQAAVLFAQSFELAGRWDAHVEGMFSAAPVAIHPALRGPQLDDWMAGRLKERQQEGEAIRASFERARTQAAANGDWRGEDPVLVPDSRIVLDFARCADVTIICNSRGDSDFMDPDLTIEDLLIGSGRPTLILPSELGDQAPGKRIAIAWNGSREAARTVHDAMPLLQSAPDGCVHIICPPGKDDSNRLPSGTELAEALGRQGIKAEVAALKKTHLNAGPDLLAKAGELGADLLVMGAWGHSRLREFVLGGATDTALRESRIAVFMSH